MDPLFSIVVAVVGDVVGSVVAHYIIKWLDSDG